MAHGGEEGLLGACSLGDADVCLLQFDLSHLAIRDVGDGADEANGTACCIALRDRPYPYPHVAIVPSLDARLDIKK